MARTYDGNEKKIVISICLDRESKELLHKLAKENHSSVSAMVVGWAWAVEHAKKQAGDVKDE